MNEPAGYSGQDSAARTFVRERYVYHSGIDGETFSIGASSMQSPLMRLTDENGDGDYEDFNDRIDFFLTNRRGDVVAITSRGGSHVNLVASQPGKVQCKVLYSAYGVPRACHLLDMDRDGVVGHDTPNDEYFEDLDALEEATGRVLLDPRWRVLSMVYCASEWPCVEPPPMTNEQYFAANYPLQPRDMLAEMSGSSGMPLYAGYWWDDRLKLFHVRHRVYDPRAGRFLQRDPIGYAGGSNLYMYAGNSPFRYVDPMGLDSYLIGSGLRDIGWDEWGDIADDFVDGARELGDTFSGARSAGDVAHAALIGSTIDAQAQHVTDAKSFTLYVMFQESGVHAVGEVRRVEDTAIAQKAPLNFYILE